MNNKLQKLAPAWHDEAVDLLKANFDKIHANFLDSTKKAVWMGMFLNSIAFRGDKKTGDGSIPHGELGPWLEKNVPDLARDTITTYRKLAKNVCEKGKFEIADFPHFAHCGDLPPAIQKMIEGKTQQQLFLQFKNVDANGDPLKAGCAPGKARRLSIGEQAEALKILAEANWKEIEKFLHVYRAKFTTLTDLDVQAQMAVLEQHLNARRAWLKQPKNNRVVSSIDHLFK